MRHWIASAAALALAGCGGAGHKDGTTTNALAGTGTGGTVGGGMLSTASWDATDACKLLPKEKVAAVVGRPVTEATLDMVNKSDGSNASVSSCHYTFGDGKRLSFLARWSPVDMSDAEVAETRQTVMEMGKDTVDVPGLGRAAFRNRLTMVVIPDQRRYISFTSFEAPAGVDLPAAEITLAKAALG